MSGHGEKLTYKREQAIAALLAAPSITAAAQQIGVNENTLLRWLQEQTFRDAYRDARREVVRQAVVQVQQACSIAVATLTAVMQDAEAAASARVAAARTVLETAMKALELEDLEARIVALEQGQKVSK